MTKVTVVMAVYNGMPYLKEAVESIRNQTLRTFRFLVVDDASTDGSRSYLRSLSDDRIELIEIPRNGGQGAARNIAIARCETEFTAQMDADDVAFPDRLERQADFLSRHPDVGMVGSRIIYQGSSGRRGFPPPLPLEHEDIHHHLLQGRHALCNPTLMFRTDILQRIGGYRLEGCGEDWDLFLRTAENTRVANLPETLLAYRIHPGSDNATKLREMRTSYSYSIECARRRLLGEREPSFKEFMSGRRQEPRRRRLMRKADDYASTQYRKALAEILGASPLRGYLRLGWSAVSSPPRTLQYVTRKVRGER